MAVNTVFSDSKQRDDGPYLSLDRVRMRYFPLWAFGVMIVLAVSIKFFLPINIDDSPTLFGGFIVFAIVIGWTAWIKWKHHISISAIFGSLPNTPTALGCIFLSFLSVEFIEDFEIFLLVPFLKDTHPFIADFYLTSSASSIPENFWGYLMHSSLPILVAPFVEELFFRGILFQRWYRSWGSLTLALISSSLLFALLHGNLFSAFAFSIFATLLYVKFKSLWAPIILHSFSNFITSIGGSRLEYVFNIYNIGSAEIGFLSLISFFVLSFITYRYFGLEDTKMPYIRNLS